MTKITYFVTGVSGFVGASIVRHLLIHKQKVQIRIVGQCRQLERTRMFLLDDEMQEMEFIEADITNFDACLSALQEKSVYPDYIIHCAAPTKSAYMVSNPVETTESIVTGTGNILELAKRFQVKSMVYLSSMEVYGQIECAVDKLIGENELGDIDIFNLRSCYPLGKRMAESLCFSYFKEYDVPVKIARLAQTFGRGVNKNDTRVFAQFANAVRENKDIVLHTQGDSMGNYCDIDDAVEAILLLLEKGANGEAYNVVNEANTMTIREMAEMVAGQVAYGKIKVVFDIPSENIHGYAAKTGLKLSSEKIEKLGWKPNTGLKEMYEKMIVDMDK